MRLSDLYLRVGVCFPWVNPAIGITAKLQPCFKWIILYNGYTLTPALDPDLSKEAGG